MTGREHDELADAYLHALLSPAEAHDFEKRAAESPPHAEALARARQRLGLLQSLPPTEPSGRLVENTMGAVAQHEQSWKRLRWRYALCSTLGVAAAAIVLLVLTGYYDGLRPTGPDLTLLGQSSLLASSRAVLRVRLFDPQAGAPLSGVPVRFELLAPNGDVRELGEAETDEQGNIAQPVSLPDWAEGAYELRVSGAGETATHFVQLTRPLRVMLSSDRPIYKPGQTILLRSLALRVADLRPADDPAVFRLIDPAGNVLFKHAMKASKFGIASAECPLDPEVAEGRYTVTCTVGKTESKLAVEVKRYVLPKFNVKVSPRRDYYAPGETAKVGVQATYVFGKPVAGADVVVRMFLSGDKGPRTWKGKADANGHAEADFQLPLVAGEEGRVRFEAEVADGAGQKLTRSASRVVTTARAQLDVVPEAGALVPGVSNVVYLLARMPDGLPISNSSVEVEGEGVRRKVTTGATGAASFEVVPSGQQLGLTFRVHLPQGGTWETSKVLQEQAGAEFLLRPGRARYRAGETLELLILGRGDGPVFLDVFREGQTALSETVNLKQGRGELALDLPPDLVGAVRLVAYRVGPGGVEARQERLVYVAPAEGLKVSAELDRAEYRPGDNARLLLSLRDAKGRPAPGAVSLAAVDEAVFALLSSAPGAERQFFTPGRELLEPARERHPWSPDGPPSPARDRAVFAAASKVGPGITHTLTADTYSEKQKRVSELRGLRLSQVRTAWLAMGGLSLLLAYVSLWLYLRASTVLLISAGLGTFALGLVLTWAASAMFPGSRGGEAFERIGAAFGGAPGAKDMAAAKAEAFLANTQRASALPGAAPRVRKHFPETMLWLPEKVTDDNGRATVEFKVADSITNWRLSASGVTADGKLGAVVKTLRAFKPFFVELDLPTHLTRGDEVTVPVVVYSYLNEKQTVRVKIETSDGLALLGKAEAVLELGPNDVKSVRFPVRAVKAGQPTLTVTATAGGKGDASQRAIQVEPDGRRVEAVFNGDLAKQAEFTLDVPKEAIEGSVYAEVKFYPSRFSQLVEGLDGIFRMPHGCFEQTSSTTYPNVLALQYLKQAGLKNPGVEKKARHYIHLGYQRLVRFEVPDGGFDWYGRPPGNVGLTAYGLLEFRDMANVHQVDPKLIARTREWLLKQRGEDGSWEGHWHSASNGKLGMTAYVGWAVFSGEKPSAEAALTRSFLLGHRPATIKSPYAIALVCLALDATGAMPEQLSPYLDALAAMRKDEAASGASWRQPAGERTAFYGAGPAGDVETTAAAALALLAGKRHPELVRRSLKWLASQKDGQGTWGSTQATVLALKALVAGASAPAKETRREFVVSVNGHDTPVPIPANQAEVMKREPLRPLKAGANKIVLREKTNTTASYQVVFRYHVPATPPGAAKAPVALSLAYSRTKLAQGGAVKARAALRNNTGADMPMVMLELPVPPGFDVDASALDELVKKGTIGRVQVEARRVLVYLRNLPARQELEVEYGLRARLALKAEAPPARAWEYYDPSKQGRTAPVRFEVSEK